MNDIGFRLPVAWWTDRGLSPPRAHVWFHGSDIKTPNLNKLAEGGARLEQFYA